MTTSVIELLNPNKYWNIGSNNQVIKLYAHDASFNNKLDVPVINSGTIKVGQIDVSNLNITENILASDGTVGGKITFQNIDVINSLFFNDVCLNNNLYIGLSNDSNQSHIYGPEIIYIDPKPVNDVSGKVVIMGDLDIKGIETTINSQTVTISDNIIELNANASTIEYGGIKVKTNNTEYPEAKFLWSNSQQSWTTSGDSIITNIVGNAFTVQTINNFSTDDLTEGSNNLYFEESRARQAFSGGTDISISSNGVISFNPSPTSQIYYLSDTVEEISQNVNTLSTNVVTLSGEVDTLSEDVDILSTTVVSLSGEVDTLSEDVDILSTTVVSSIWRSRYFI